MSRLFIVILSLLISLVFMIIPIMNWLSNIWPIWVIPVLMFWSMSMPQRTGLWRAWLIGIVLDLLNNAVLGTHAIALLICCALFSKMARRFGFFSGLQQMLCIMFFTALYLFLLALAQIYTNQAVLSIELFWWPAITTGLVWPIISAILQHYRQRYRIR